MTVNSKDENVKTFVSITSKNSASVLLMLMNFVMQPVCAAKSNNPASLVDTQKILLLFEIFKRKNIKKRNSRKKTVYAYASRDWRETLRWVN
jgi:hypothetical protein